MAGILDGKKRVLDVVLTDIGRDQMNRGEFEVSFVTFSDKGSEYLEGNSIHGDGSGVGVAASILDKFYFETYGSPTDEIVPEVDNTGDLLLTKQISPTLTVNNGVLFEKTEKGYAEVDAFANIDKFTKLTSNRYAGLQLLRTSHSIPDFSLNREAIEMKFTDRKLPENVDALNPILVDQRFTGNLNTMYLPPIVKANGVDTPMKAYNRFGKEHTLDNIVNEVKDKSWSHARLELGSEFTYENYNILGQVYIKQGRKVRKLLVVDAGEFVNGDNVPILQVYHFGFVFKDENGTSKFTRSFSMLLHNGDI